MELQSTSVSEVGIRRKSFVLSRQALHAFSASNKERLSNSTTLFNGPKTSIKLGTSPNIIDNSPEECDKDLRLLWELSLEKGYICRANEDLSFGSQNQMVATTPVKDEIELCQDLSFGSQNQMVATSLVKDEIELCPPQLPNNIQATTNLVTLLRRCRTANYRIKKNAVVLKPLDVNKSDPSRLLFHPNEIKEGDTLTVLVRARSVPEQDEFIRVPPIASQNKCACFEQHPGAVFCVTAGWDPRNVLSWHASPGENPRAEILINNLKFLKIEFASLYPQSTLFSCRIPPFSTQELVFRLKKTNVTLEQNYFIKCSAAPSRDKKPFLQYLYNYGLISREPKEKSPYTSVFPHQGFPHFIRTTSLSAEECKYLEEENIQILNIDVSSPPKQIK